MKETIEKIKESFEKGNTIDFRNRKCLYCDYKVGYILRDYKVYFDRGCYCVPPKQRVIEERDWQRFINNKFLTNNLTQ